MNTCPFCFKMTKELNDEYSFYLFSQSCCSYHLNLMSGILNKGDTEVLVSVIKALFARLQMNKICGTTIERDPTSVLYQGSDIVLKRVKWESRDCIVKIMPTNNQSLRELCITAALTYAKTQVEWLGVSKLKFSYFGESAKSVLDILDCWKGLVTKVPNNPMVIILENSGDDLRDFNFRKLEDKLSVFIQIIQTYKFLDAKFSFIHDDISLKNITAKYLEESKRVYVGNSRRYFDTNIEGSIIDYGLSSMTFSLEGKENTFSNLIRKASVEQDRKYLASLIKNETSIDCSHCTSFYSLEKHLFKCLLKCRNN